MIELKRVRQIALLTRDLEQSLAFWQNTFGLEECFRDDLSAFGLINVLLPIGDTFLELLQPVDSNSPGARFLKWRGESLSRIVFESAGTPAHEVWLQEQQIPVIWRIDRPRYSGVRLHPKAMNRLLVSIVDPHAAEEPGRWPPAGDNWRSRVHTEVVSQIFGATFVTDALDCDVGRWHRLFGLTPSRYFVRDGARLAPVPVGDGGSAVEFMQPLEPSSAAARYMQRHGPGMYFLMLATPDLDMALSRVRAHGVAVVRIDANADGSRSAWLHPRSMHGVMTELIERRPSSG